MPLLPRFCVKNAGGEGSTLLISHTILRTIALRHITLFDNIIPNVLYEVNRDVA